MKGESACLIIRMVVSISPPPQKMFVVASHKNEPYFNNIPIIPFYGMISICIKIL